MGSFYTESSYNFGTNSAQFPADRERHKGEAANDTKERPRAVQRKTKRTLLQETGRMIPCLPQYRPPFVDGQSEESSVCV